MKVLDGFGFSPAERVGGLLLADDTAVAFSIEPLFDVWLVIEGEEFIALEEAGFCSVLFFPILRGVVAVEVVIFESAGTCETLHESHLLPVSIILQFVETCFICFCCESRDICLRCMC